MQTTSLQPPAHQDPADYSSMQMQTSSVPPSGSSSTEIQESSNIEIQTSTVLPMAEQNPSDNSEKSEKRKKEERLNEMRNAIIVMASLIITLTFQIAISPPGGVWQDFAPNPTPGTKHEPGKVILYDLARTKYKILMATNFQTFVCSVIVIVLLVRPLGTKWLSEHWLATHIAISAAPGSLVVEFILILAMTIPQSLFNSTGYIVGTISWTVFLCTLIFASPWVRAQFSPEEV